MRIPTGRVRDLRHNQTEAENAAWHLLRGRQLGAKCRRQCRIENWVVDFYCFEHRLAVELDGSVHSQPSQMRRDAAKEDYLRTIGNACCGFRMGWCWKIRRDSCARCGSGSEGLRIRQNVD